MRHLTCVPPTVYQILYPLKGEFRCPQAHHFRIFCWAVVALAVQAGPGTVKSLSRVAPERVTYWAMLRMLRSGYWDPDALVTELSRVLLLTLPPPADHTLYLLADPTLKRKRGRKHPLGKKTRTSSSAPYVFGFELVMLVAAWGRVRVPVAFALVDPAVKGHANELLRQMLRRFEPPSWAERVVVTADAGMAANQTFRVIEARGWAFVFATSRTRRFSDGKQLRDLIEHLPHARYRRLATRKPDGRRADYWVYSRPASLNGLGDVTIILSKQRRNDGPKRIKIIVTNLEGVSAREVLGMYARRWGVEIVQSQMTKPRRLTARADRHDVADLDLVIGHDDAIDEKFDQHPLLLEGRFGQTGLNSATEVFDRRHHSRQLDAPLDLYLELKVLFDQSLPLVFQVAAPPPIFLESEDVAQVRLGHSLDLVVEARHASTQAVAASVKFLGEPVSGPRPLERLRDDLRVCQHLTHVGPYQLVELSSGRQASQALLIAAA